MESPWIGSERVAEEQDEVPRGKVRRWFSLAASQVPQRTDAHAGAGGEGRRGRGANAGILLMGLGHPGLIGGRILACGRRPGRTEPRERWVRGGPAFTPASA